MARGDCVHLDMDDSEPQDYNTLRYWRELARQPSLTALEPPREASIPERRSRNRRALDAKVRFESGRTAQVVDFSTAGLAIVSHHPSPFRTDIVVLVTRTSSQEPRAEHAESDAQESLDSDELSPLRLVAVTVWCRLVSTQRQGDDVLPIYHAGLVIREPDEATVGPFLARRS